MLHIQPTKRIKTIAIYCEVKFLLNRINLFYISEFPCSFKKLIS